MFILVSASPEGSSRIPSPNFVAETDDEPPFFLGLDLNLVKAHLKDCLDSLKQQAGHVELLCRFGKMIFTDVPEDLMDAPIPSEAVYNIVRSRQIHYTFEGGAGIPESAIESAVESYKLQGDYASKQVYYLSVVPDASLGLDRKWRLDVMLERRPEPTEDGQTIHFIGVREPYLKPFKADIMSLRADAVDVRIAIRASPRPIAPEVQLRIEEFASTIRSASEMELEYPAKSPFRVTGCALKTVQTIRMPHRNLAVEVVHHEQQDSHRRFEYAATTMAMEDVLGKAGSGLVISTAPQWSSESVLSLFDEMTEKSYELGDHLVRK